MPVVGVGTDIVDVSRISGLMERGGRRFLERWLRPAEVDYCLEGLPGAGRAAMLLAVKEAVFKAVGAPGANAAPWRDIEIHGDPVREADVQLYGSIRTWAEAAEIATFSVSASREGRLVMALVVAS